MKRTQWKTAGVALACLCCMAGCILVVLLGTPRKKPETPETTIPETTAPGTTSPESSGPPVTSSPETTHRETSRPSTSAPETTAKASAPPETTAPVTQKIPEVSVWYSTVLPETTAPATGVPENPFLGGGETILTERRASEYVPEGQPGPGEGVSF